MHTYLYKGEGTVLWIMQIMQIICRDTTFSAYYVYSAIYTVCAYMHIAVSIKD